ncbi:EcsC family protein [Mesobacterium pallidum]|uniref:EcsC family protein n=1 Tax=Mesobacterium pallidum TaxID=2872037 RepID=UPI001EE2929F|nr:EcsC family protein [Mesobacterium pallidum]
MEIVPGMTEAQVNARLDELARRHKAASGLGVQLLNVVGGQAENLLDRLPGSVKERLDGATEAALRTAMNAAGRSRKAVPDQAGWLNTAVSAALGGAGGFGGLPSALAELPVTVTVLLRAIQGVAARHGFDPDDEVIRLACLEVLGTAGPLDDDDGAELSFLAARVTLTGATVRGLLAKVAPRLATVLGQKLAAQTVPVLGAVTGAATNYIYTNYYQEMAEIQFGILALARDSGTPREELLASLRDRLRPPQVKRA